MRKFPRLRPVRKGLKGAHYHAADLSHYPGTAASPRCRYVRSNIREYRQSGGVARLAYNPIRPDLLSW